VTILNIFSLHICASLFYRYQLCKMSTYRSISVVNELSFTSILIRIVGAFLNKSVTNVF